ncbi:MAG TPA: D-2-hydroxyacid dehydrogenase [Steroidobacteraceae bacterium]|mgnify:CR=1 FL=1|nr:D-2-hydroxyacid dehydrogenase [Steroidobacteraceae bacterium]HRX90655.1 D-2-hydroxyacid dehydrogenase [Steroidobacteraceae bacterium]
MRAAALTLVALGMAQAALADTTSTAGLVDKYGLVESTTPVAALPNWRKPQRIVVDSAVPGLLAAVREAAPGVNIVAAQNVAEMAAARADAAIGRTSVICDDSVLASGRNLRWLQSIYSGIEDCIGKRRLQSGEVLLTNMRAVAGPIIAEHTIAMLLALSRGLHRSIPQQANGELSDDYRTNPLVVLQGKTLLVVGLGGIGTEVAKRAEALGMQVIATRASSKPAPSFVKYVGKPAELTSLIATADVVVNTAPLTAATQGMFDAGMFARMKTSAYFVNVARGGAVVTDDLVAALQSQRIAGAALDVTDPEPLPKNHPLWRMPNVILTPHVAGMSDLGDEAQREVVGENLRRYIAGERMLSVVDLEREY